MEELQGIVPPGERRDLSIAHSGFQSIAADFGADAFPRKSLSETFRWATQLSSSIVIDFPFKLQLVGSSMLVCRDPEDKLSWKEMFVRVEGESDADDADVEPRPRKFYIFDPKC